VPDLIGILGQPGSLILLKLASGKTQQSSKFLHSSGMTDSQAKTRLVGLARAGLIERSESKFHLTPFGRAVLGRYIPRLEAAFLAGRRPDE